MEVHRSDCSKLGATCIAYVEMVIEFHNSIRFLVTKHPNSRWGKMHKLNVLGIWGINFITIAKGSWIIMANLWGNILVTSGGPTLANSRIVTLFSCGTLSAASSEVYCVLAALRMTSL